jgi:hypothetical protein
MAYNHQQVATMIRHAGSIQRLAPFVGQSESSTTAQHAAAITFFEIALKLKEPDYLSTSDVELARSEIARHQQALQSALLEIESPLSQFDIV